MKEWNSPSLEVLDVSLTMKGVKPPGEGGGGGGGKCRHHKRCKDKPVCETPGDPPDLDS